MAAELTDDQRRVLQLVYEEHQAQAAWPTFGTLDRRVARSKRFPDLGQVVRELPAGLLLPLWSGGMGPRPDAEMKLTAQGLACCEGAEDDVELFLRALRWFAKRELKFEPTSGEPVNECFVSGRQLVRGFRLPAERRPDVERLGRLLVIEQWGCTGSSGSGLDWRVGLGRDVRRFASVRSIEEYVAIKDKSLRESALPPLPMFQVETAKEVPVERSSLAYVDDATIDHVVQAAASVGLSTDKLTVLLKELNDNYSRGNAYACHSLLRAILDHVPPAFGYQSFGEVANSFTWGRTDKRYMRKLVDFRLQADDALHR
ncbi:MAG: hypothetical protein ACYDC9_05255, partial [Dermatophilaceae bacterium]